MTIQSVAIKIDRAQAAELYQKYKSHVHYAKPIDREIQRTYQLIGQGRTVIRALESIKVAGMNEQGFPKLAILRADQRECYFDSNAYDGRGRFGPNRRWMSRDTRSNVVFPENTFPKKHTHGKAIAPIIPLHLRPKRGLQNYHVLWEAEWTRVPPVDPLLLRRIGKGDLWLVVAGWDLTEVERAALATRMNG